MKKQYDFQAENLINAHKRRGHLKRGVALLSAVVMLFTMNSLKLNADTLERKPMCGLEEHKHTLECYPLICGQEERDPVFETQRVYTGKLHAHKHTDACYTETGKLFCGYVEGEYWHVHNRFCHDEDGNLVCGLKERRPHEHTDACYEDVATLSCGMEEFPAHHHTDECYTDHYELICGQEETDGHHHTDDCFIERDELTCGKAESDGHVHTDDCYYEWDELTCGKEESDGHQHDKHCYYEWDELTCGQVESEGHQHTDDCYFEWDEQVCDKVESDGHHHTEDCFRKELVCGEIEDEDHEHTDECYEEVCICGMKEGEGAHTHTEECFEHHRELFCGMEEGEGAHTHTKDCYEHHKERICGMKEGEGAHHHSDKCYTHKREKICGMKEGEGAHHHTDKCYTHIRENICGLEEGEGAHHHTEDCYSVWQELTCGQEETDGHTHTDECYTHTLELRCGKDEAERIAKKHGLDGLQLHYHTDDCFITVDREVDGEVRPVRYAICGYEEVPNLVSVESNWSEGFLMTDRGHTHTAECYDTTVEPICGLPEHEHTDACFQQRPQTPESAAGEAEASLGDCDVKLSWGEDAGLPEDARAEIREIGRGDEYDALYARAQDALGEPGEAVTRAMRFFDIAIYNNEETLTPEAPVNVEIRVNAAGAANANALRFDGDGAEALDATTFETEALGVFGVAYTMPAETQENNVSVTVDLSSVDLMEAATVNSEGVTLSVSELLKGADDAVSVDGALDVDNAHFLQNAEVTSDSADVQVEDGKITLSADALENGSVSLQMQTEVVSEDHVTTVNTQTVEIALTGYTGRTEGIDEENITVTALGDNSLPADAKATVDESAKVPDSVVVEEGEGAAAFDITITNDNGHVISDTGSVAVTVKPTDLNVLADLPEGANPTGFHYELVHIHDDGSSETIQLSEKDVVLDEEGNVQSFTFETETFSTYVLKYTVDFEYVDEAGEAHTWSFPGAGSYRIIEVLAQLGIEAQTVTSAELKLVEAVDETSDAALYLTQDADGEWWINSDVAFDDTYELTVVADGRKYVITVTDYQLSMTELDDFYNASVVFLDADGQRITDSAQLPDLSNVYVQAKYNVTVRNPWDGIENDVVYGCAEVNKGNFSTITNSINITIKDFKKKDDPNDRTLIAVNSKEGYLVTGSADNIANAQHYAEGDVVCGAYIYRGESEGTFTLQKRPAASVNIHFLKNDGETTDATPALNGSFYVLLKDGIGNPIGYAPFTGAVEGLAFTSDGSTTVTVPNDAKFAIVRYTGSDSVNLSLLNGNGGGVTRVDASGNALEYYTYAWGGSDAETNVFTITATKLPDYTANIDFVDIEGQYLDIDNITGDFSNYFVVGKNGDNAVFYAPVDKTAIDGIGQIKDINNASVSAMTGITAVEVRRYTGGEVNLNNVKNGTLIGNGEAMGNYLLTIPTVADGENNFRIVATKQPERSTTLKYVNTSGNQLSGDVTLDGNYYLIAKVGNQDMYYAKITGENPVEGQALVFHSTDGAVVAALPYITSVHLQKSSNANPSSLSDIGGNVVAGITADVGGATKTFGISFDVSNSSYAFIAGETSAYNVILQFVDSNGDLVSNTGLSDSGFKIFTGITGKDKDGKTVQWNNFKTNENGGTDSVVDLTQKTQTITVDSFALMQQDTTHYYTAGEDVLVLLGKGITVINRDSGALKYENGKLYGTYINDGEEYGGYIFSYDQTVPGQTTITARKPNPMGYTVKVVKADGTTAATGVNLNSQDWYIQASVARNDGTYIYTEKISDCFGQNSNPTNVATGSFGIFYRKTSDGNKGTGYNVGENVSFALLRPKDGGSHDWAYFANTANINTNALDGSSVESLYTLHVDNESHVLTLQEAPTASVELKSYSGETTSSDPAAPVLTNSGTYYIAGEMFVQNGTVSYNTYAWQPLTSSDTQTLPINSGLQGKKPDNGNATEYLTGRRFIDPVLIFIPASSSVNANDTNAVLTALRDGSDQLTVYHDGDAVEGYRLKVDQQATLQDGSTPEDETVAKMHLVKLPTLSVKNVLDGAADANNTYYTLTELKRGEVTAYALTQFTSGSTVNITHFEDASGNKVYYQEGDEITNYAIKVANTVTGFGLAEAVAGTDCKRYAAGQMMGSHIPTFAMAGTTITTTLKEVDTTGTAHNVNVQLYARGNSKLAQADPVIPGEYYVLAWLTPKMPEDNKQVVGYTFYKVDMGVIASEGVAKVDALNTAGVDSETILTGGFKAVDASLAVTGDTLGYDASLYNMNLRLYKKINDWTNNSDVTQISYSDIRESGALTDEAPTGYDFLTPTTVGTTSEIRLRQAYDKEYKLRVDVDQAGLTIKENEHYVVRVKLTHYNGDIHYAFAKLVVDGDDGETYLTFFDNSGHIWYNYNGTPTDYVMTGNEKSVRLDVLLLTKSLEDSSLSNLHHDNPSSNDGVVVHKGESVNRYTVSDSERLPWVDSQVSETPPSWKTTITDVIHFVMDNGDISKGIIDGYLETATDFGLYTEILSVHGTDMESNIGADRLTGQIGADYGYSGNNLQINRVKVVKKYIDAENGTVVKLRLYPVDPKTGALGTPVEKKGTIVNETAVIEFDKLVAGTYILKEVINGREYSYNAATNGIVTTSDGTITISFNEDKLVIKPINVNVNYFGQIDGGVDLWSVIRHSRNGTIVSDKPGAYDDLLRANGGAAQGPLGWVYKTGSEDFPTKYNIPSDMAALRVLSERLGEATSSQTVRIVNKKLSEINGAEYLNLSDDGRFIVVNVDVSGAGSTIKFNPMTKINGVTLMPDFGHGGNEYASRVLYNFITRDSSGNATPYTGHIDTSKEGAGVLLAPSAVVGDLAGNWGGTIICHEAQHTGSEIHSDSANKTQNINTVLTNSKSGIDTGDLELQKVLFGESMDHTTWFTFEVTLKDENGGVPAVEHRTYTASGLKDKSATSVTFDNEGKLLVQVRAQNKVLITGIPDGYTYTVKEIETPESEHYQLVQIVDAEGELAPGDPKTYATTATGTIEEKVTDVVKVVNAHKVGGLTIGKVVKGDTAGNSKFRFEVKLSPNSASSPAVTESQIYGKYFGGMYFNSEGYAESTDDQNQTHPWIELGDGQSVTAKDIPTGTRFEITELDADLNGFVTSVNLIADVPAGRTEPTVTGATVTGEIIEDGEGNKIAIIAAYKNAHYEGTSYTPKATKSLVLEGTSTVADDAAWPSEGFTFTITPINEYALDTANKGIVSPTMAQTAKATAASKTAVFPALMFSNSNDATWITDRTFTYTITETVPDDAVNANGTRYGDLDNSLTYEQKAAEGPWKLHGVTYNTTPVTLTIVVGPQTTLGNETLLEIKSATYSRGATVISEGVKEPAGSQVAINAAEAEITNEIDDAHVDVDLEATKDLVGRVLQAEEFTFQLKQGDTVLQTKTNGVTDPDVDVSKVKFETLRYTRADMVGATLNPTTGKYEKTFTYTIVEVEGTDPAVTYDTAPRTATVKLVEASSDTITAEVTYAPAAGAVFTNTAKTSISVEKVWQNADGSTTWPTGVTVTASLRIRTTDGTSGMTTDTTDGIYIVDLSGETPELTLLTGYALNKVLDETHTSASWENLAILPEGSSYVVLETKVNDTDVTNGIVTVGNKTYSSILTVDGAATTITNTEQEFTQIEAEKTWATNYTKTGREKVTLQLYASRTAPVSTNPEDQRIGFTLNTNWSTAAPDSGSITVTVSGGQSLSREYVLNASNGWTLTGELPKYMDDGTTPATYTAAVTARDETAVSSATIDSNAITDGGTVTVSAAKVVPAEKISITVSVPEWVNMSGSASTAPTSQAWIWVGVQKDGVTVTGAEHTFVPGDWSHVFSVDQLAEGNYTVAFSNAGESTNFVTNVAVKSDSSATVSGQSGGTVNLKGTNNLMTVPVNVTWKNSDDTSATSLTGSAYVDVTVGTKSVRIAGNETSKSVEVEKVSSDGSHPTHTVTATGSSDLDTVTAPDTFATGSESAINVTAKLAAQGGTTPDPETFDVTVGITTFTGGSTSDPGQGYITATFHPSDNSGDVSVTMDASHRTSQTATLISGKTYSVSFTGDNNYLTGATVNNGAATSNITAASTITLTATVKEQASDTVTWHVSIPEWYKHNTNYNIPMDAPSGGSVTVSAVYNNNTIASAVLNSNNDWEADLIVEKVGNYTNFAYAVDGTVVTGIKPENVFQGDTPVNNKDIELIGVHTETGDTINVDIKVVAHNGSSGWQLNLGSMYAPGNTNTVSMENLASSNTSIARTGLPAGVTTDGLLWTLPIDYASVNYSYKVYSGNDEIASGTSGPITFYGKRQNIRIEFTIGDGSVQVAYLPDSSYQLASAAAPASQPSLFDGLFDFFGATANADGEGNTIKTYANLQLPNDAQPVQDAIIILDGTADIAGEYEAWKGRWENLKVKDDDGPIYYYVKEIKVEGVEVYGEEVDVDSSYTYQYNHDDQGRVTSVSKVTVNNAPEIPEKVDIEATKQWYQSNGTPINPENIQVQFTLKKSSAQVGEVKTVSGNGTAKWTQLDPGSYTVEETGIKFPGDSEFHAPDYYDIIPVYDGLLVKNTLPETSITATKAWANANGSTTPPTGAKVTFTLLSDGHSTGRTVLVDGVVSSGNDYEDNYWTAHFTHLPKYTDAGQLISYSVQETGKWSNYDANSDTVSSGGTITNTEQKGNLSLTKVVNGISDPNKVFTFQVTLNARSGGVIDGTYETIRTSAASVQTTGTQAVTGGTSFAVTLKAGETWQINGLPVGATWAINESATPGYICSGIVAAGDKTAIENGATVALTATNNYSASGSFQPEVSKTFTNGVFTAEQFEFILTEVDDATSTAPKTGTTPQSVKVSNGEPVPFQPINYTRAIFADDAETEKTLYYTITEKLPDGLDAPYIDDNGIKYDPTVHRIEVTLTDDKESNLNKVIKLDGKTVNEVEVVVEFINEQLGQLQITKTVNSAVDARKAGTFWYAVYAAEDVENGAPKTNATPVRKGSITVAAPETQGAAGTASATETNLPYGEYYVFELTGENGTPIVTNDVPTTIGTGVYKVSGSGTKATVSATAGTATLTNTVPETSITGKKTWVRYTGESGATMNPLDTTLTLTLERYIVNDSGTYPKDDNFTARTVTIAAGADGTITKTVDGVSTTIAMPEAGSADYIAAWSYTWENLELYGASLQTKYAYMVTETLSNNKFHRKDGETSRYLPDEGVQEQVQEFTNIEYAPVSLPATGGIGTTGFTVAGAGLMALALLGILLRVRRRRHGEGID